MTNLGSTFIHKTHSFILRGGVVTLRRYFFLKYLSVVRGRWAVGLESGPEVGPGRDVLTAECVGVRKSPPWTTALSVTSFLSVPVSSFIPSCLDSLSLFCYSCQQLCFRLKLRPNCYSLRERLSIEKIDCITIQWTLRKVHKQLSRYS